MNRPVPSFEVGLIGFWVYFLRFFQRSRFLWIQSHLDPLGNRAGYAVLQCERVLQISFIALRPEVLFIRHLDQLGRDPYAFAGSQDGSFYHRLHVQLAGDLG